MKRNIEIPPRVCPNCQRENLPFAPNCFCGQDLTGRHPQVLAHGPGTSPISSTEPEVERPV